MRTLHLVLDAPMMSFGTTAIDNHHPIARFPGHAAIVGLIANALGVDRTEHHRLEELQNALRIASRVERAGHLETDYQTAGGPDNPAFGNDDKTWSRRGEDGLPVVENRTTNDKNLTFEMWKDYWADSRVAVFAQLPDDDAEAAASALRRPARPLFIGRKAFLPAEPIFRRDIGPRPPEDAVRMEPILDKKADAPPFRAQIPVSKDLTNKTEVVVHDMKDWRNNIPSGFRRVHEITVDPARAMKEQNQSTTPP